MTGWSGDRPGRARRGRVRPAAPRPRATTGRSPHPHPAHGAARTGGPGEWVAGSPVYGRRPVRRV